LNLRPLGYEPNDDRLGRLRRLRALYLPAPTRGDRCRCLGSSHASRRVLLAIRLANAGADLPFSAALGYLQIRRSGHIVQDRPLPVMCWSDVPELSAWNRPCPAAWQQYRQQTGGAAREPNRISSSGRGRSDRFKLDQPTRPVFSGRRRTAVNCNPNCNPQIRRSGRVVQDRLLQSVRWPDIPQLSTRGGRCPAAWQQHWQQSRPNGAVLDRPFSGRTYPKLPRIARA
jgi:hypothetical protein